MTYQLPFGLKQKPLSHYVEGGIIRFNMLDGHLFYTVRKIDKTVNACLILDEIESKEELDRLLSAKSLHEIPSIEEVIS